MLPACKTRKTEPPTLNPDPQSCSFYVHRKHRFCRTASKPGSRYCCTHDIASDGASQACSPAAGADAEPRSSTTDLSGRSEDVRVPCPVNPNHTVYASRLGKHIKVCPDLRHVTDHLPYFSKDKHANRGAALCRSPGDEPSEGGRLRCTHRDFSAHELQALISKVKVFYNAYVKLDIVEMGQHGSGDEREGAREAGAAVVATGSSADTFSTSHTSPAASPSVEFTSKKHGPQHVALLRCLSDVVLQSSDEGSIVARAATTTTPQPPPPHTPIRLDGFLEFGAGKGGLSVALQQLLLQRNTPPNSTGTDGDPHDTNEAPALAETSGRGGAAPPLSSVVPPCATLPAEFLASVVKRPSLVVLDVDGFRRKGDARVRHSAIPLQRLRINIKDVDLGNAFRTAIAPVGSSAASPAARRQEENWAVLGKHLCGACTDFALSCLREVPTLASELQVRLPVVVLATCCHHRCEMRHLNPPLEASSSPALLSLPGTSTTWSENEFSALASMSSWAVCGGFVDEERRAVGRQCKRIIDQFRVGFLRQLGYVAFQCQYTTRDVTEENVCIVAYKW